MASKSKVRKSDDINRGLLQRLDHNEGQQRENKDIIKAVLYNQETTSSLTQLKVKVVCAAKFCREMLAIKAG